MGSEATTYLKYWLSHPQWQRSTDTSYQVELFGRRPTRPLDWVSWQPTPKSDESCRRKQKHFWHTLCQHLLPRDWPLRTVSRGRQWHWQGDFTRKTDAAYGERCIKSPSYRRQREVDAHQGGYLCGVREELSVIPPVNLILVEVLIEFFGEDCLASTKIISNNSPVSCRASELYLMTSPNSELYHLELLSGQIHRFAEVVVNDVLDILN